MDLVRGWPIRRFQPGKVEDLTDAVIAEARIELDINDGMHRQAMLALPADLEALAVGFLATEGVLHSRDELTSVEVLPATGRVLVHGDFDADVLATMAERWTWGSGCGGGGTSREIDSPAYVSVRAGQRITAARLIELAKDFHSRATLWKQTGCVHACALASAEGVLLFAEDIGRHNAFDKVIGKAMLDGIDVADKLALMTGRLSAEIVSKAVTCGVPMLVSRSAVTYLGIKLARKFGVSLVGFLRGQRLNVYTGDRRIISETNPGEPGQ